MYPINLIVAIIFIFPILVVWNGARGQKKKDPMKRKIIRAIWVVLIELMIVLLFFLFINSSLFNFRFGC
jgi:hypothetical protein